MKIYKQPKIKSIVFSFATSDTAKKLGHEPTGCWYVESQIGCEIIGHIEPNCEGYLTPDDPDLISFYNATTGRHAPSFVAYGNGLALAALGLERKSYLEQYKARKTLEKK